MRAQLIGRTISVLSVVLLCAVPGFAIVTWAPHGNAFDGGSLQSAFDVPTATLESTIADQADMTADVVVAEEQQWEETGIRRTRSLLLRIRGAIVGKIARFSASARL